MTPKELWGNTSKVNIYETQSLLAIIHEYFVLDHNCRAYQMIHEIFMQGCPFEDPFTDSE